MTNSGADSRLALSCSFCQKDSLWTKFIIRFLFKFELCELFIMYVLIILSVSAMGHRKWSVIGINPYHASVIMISGNRFIISEHIRQHKSRYDVSVVRVMCYVLCVMWAGRWFTFVSGRSGWTFVSRNKLFWCLPGVCPAKQRHLMCWKWMCECVDCVTEGSGEALQAEASPCADLLAAGWLSKLLHY